MKLKFHRWIPVNISIEARCTWGIKSTDSLDTKDYLSVLGYLSKHPHPPNETYHYFNLDPK